MEQTSPARSARLGVFTLAMINVAAVVSLRGLASEAEYGFSSAFYYLFAALFFLVPVSLVAAELATGWPEKGGVFRWVGEAFGPRWGFLAIWLQWSQNAIWFPTVLTFAAVALIFMGPNQRWDVALSANKFYTLAVVLVAYWAATIITLKGTRMSSAVSKWGAILGTLMPATVITAFGFVYWLSGNHIIIDMSWRKFFPDFTKFSNLVLAVMVFLYFAGMEMSAVHVKDVDDPKRNYPLAILLSAIITVVVFVLATLAISFIIPRTQINLTQSLLVSFDDYFKFFGVPWLGIVMAFFIAVGVFAGVTAWIAGPSKGLLAVGQSGYLPPFFQKVNRHGIQSHILLVQGLIVTLLAVLFVILPSVQAVYQLLSALTVTMYLVMYVLMFAAGIYLRYSQPDVQRSFRIPGTEDIGMWVVGGVGLVGSIVAFLLGFLPPSQIAVGSPATYITFLIVGNVVFLAIPLIIYVLRKPSWKTAEGADAIEPFTWEKKEHPPDAGPRAAA